MGYYNMNLQWGVPYAHIGDTSQFLLAYLGSLSDLS